MQRNFSTAPNCGQLFLTTFFAEIFGIFLLTDRRFCLPPHASWNETLRRLFVLRYKSYMNVNTNIQTCRALYPPPHKTILNSENSLIIALVTIQINCMFFILFFQGTLQAVYLHYRLLYAMDRYSGRI